MFWKEGGAIQKATVEVEKDEPLKLELSAFVESVQEGKTLQLLENKVLMPSLLLLKSHGKLRLGKDRVTIVDKGTYGVRLIL